MSEVLERLARIETKLDNALGTNEDHEERLRGLERSRWWLTGAAAVVAYFASHFGMGHIKL